MYSFAIADGWAPDVLWAWTQASIDIEAAVAAVDTATAALNALIADTAWDSDGVRALNEKLVELRSRTVLESVELRDASDELRRVGS